MQHATLRHRRRLPTAWAGAVLLAALLVPGGSASAQGGRIAADPATIERLYQDVAFSLFVLTSGGFSTGGFADYEDASTDARFNVYNLPLSRRFDTALLGPVELRLAVAYGEATTTSLEAVPGVGGPPGAALAADRQFLRTWNTRFEVGRPIELAPDLVLTPLVGLGYSHWSGKTVRNSVGAVPVQAGRNDVWVDALLYEAVAILEYRQRWGALNIRPGVSVNYAYIGSVDGRSSTIAQSGAPLARSRAELSGSSTVLRAALRVDGPLGITAAGTDLRWQTFVVGSYETSTHGLFPWSMELGAAVGAELGRLGRSLLGFDPGEFYVGASYLFGENLSGVRANFGFRF
jgi:autotransporter-like protein